MSQKFTPGDWRVEQTANGGYYITSDCAPMGDICDLYHKECDGSEFWKSNDAANARLIAAAPKMYEALQRFLESSPCQNHCDPDDMSCDTNFARAILEKIDKSL